MKEHLSLLPKEIEKKILDYVLELNTITRLKNGWKGIHQELDICINNNEMWEKKMYRHKVDRWRSSGFNIMISPTSKKFWRIKNRSYACICGHKNDITTKLARCQLPGCNCNNYVISEKDYACSNCKRNPRQPWTWGFMTISL